MNDPSLDAERLSAWLKSNLDISGPVVARMHPAGHSNETFFVDASNRALVLRRPPTGAFLPTAHDVLREARVLQALESIRGQHAVRAPRVLATCGDPTVLGTPFYVMERVEGFVMRETLPLEVRAHDRHAFAQRSSQELIDALAAIHRVPWEGSELATLGRPDGYLPRQVKRWGTQLEMTVPFTEERRPVTELAQAGEWLAAHIPESPRTTLVHGDFKFDNVLLRPDGTLTAVLDWEMSTLGDPFADLGWLLSFWREPGDPPALPFERRFTETPGFLGRRDLIERYERATGLHFANETFYRVLAIWKLAILLEGGFARHLLTESHDPFFEGMAEGVPALGRRALELTRAAG
ncbi:MAG: phosphotransferase family protein [Thermoplasmatota archaeon]